MTCRTCTVKQACFKAGKKATAWLADDDSREIHRDPAYPAAWAMRIFLKVGKGFLMTGRGISKFYCGSAGSIEEEWK
jgi:hypothetical protein